MLSHRNFVSNSEVLRDVWKFSENDVLLHMLPIYHTHGLFVACNLLAIVGGSIIFLEKFDVKEALFWWKMQHLWWGYLLLYQVTAWWVKYWCNTTHSTIHIWLMPLLSETHIEFERRTVRKFREIWNDRDQYEYVKSIWWREKSWNSSILCLEKIRVVNKEGHLVEHGK